LNFLSKCKAECAIQETSLLIQEFYDQFINILNNLISQGPQPTSYSVLSLPTSYMLLMDSERGTVVVLLTE